MNALGVGALTVLLSIFCAAECRKRGVNTYLLLALSVYVFWPWPNPALAYAVGFVVLAAIFDSLVRGAYPLPGDALLFLVSLALYVRTLAATILPADSGEFQFVSYVLGIAHPPGYPLYTVLAKLCTLLPVGDIAYRVNLFSALTGSLALVLLSRAVRKVTGSAMAGWVAATALGVTPTFWAQSTTANIRSLTALFTALQLNLLIAYAQSKDFRILMAFALVFGLGVTHHGSTALLALPYAAFVLLSDPALLRKPRELLRLLVAFLLSGLVLLYLPLRSAMGAPFDPRPIRSLSSFLDHVLAVGFRGDMFYFVEPGALRARLAVLQNILTLEFGWALLWLAVWGAGSMLARRRSLLLLVGGVWAVNALTAIAYRAPQTMEYMMPAHVALAFLCAYGAWSLGDLLRARTRKLAYPGAGTGVHSPSSLILATALVIPLWLGLRNYPSFAHLSRDRSAREYAQGILQQAPAGARILSNWHYATPFWYLQYVEKMRPDVEVIYVYPEGATPNSQVWLRRIEESARQRPTISTNYLQEFRASPYTFQPFAGAFLVQSGPVYQTPQDIEPLSALFGERIRLVGVDLENQSVSPAGSLTVRLYWQPAVKLERDYSFFVHLVDETGAPLGQGDTTHQAARYEVGQVIADEYRIPLLLTAKPGGYTLIAGVYITLPEGGWRRLTTTDGKDSVTLGRVEVQPLRAAPVTQHGMYRPFASGYALVGVDYDRSVAGQLRVYLHWSCEAPGAEHNLILFSRGATLATTRLPKAASGTYFSTAHDLPAAAAELALELQAVGDDVPSKWLGPARIPIGQRLSLPEPVAQDRYVCLGGEMLLVRAQYPTGFTTEHAESAARVPKSLSAGGRVLRTSMTFVGMKPITNDYTISVSLTAEDGKWRTQHDGTPALGAIPTLKWIRGVTVADEHDMPLPPEATDRGVLRLTVYDAFTMRPLPVLDERLARVGQGTQIELGSIEMR